MDILKQIQEFGLTEIEAKIYLSLLNIGEATVLELARNTGIKRATVHFNVENLINKSLISQTKKNNKRVLTAENPSNFKLLIDQKKSQLRKLENDLPSILKSMQKNIENKSQGFAMQVRYFEGKDSVKTIYSDALKGTELRSFVNLSIASRIFPENRQLFEDAVNSKSTFQLFEIGESSDITKNQKIVGVSQNLHFKFAPKSLNMSATDVLIYEGKVAVISLSENTSGMIMENNEYFEFSKGLFDFIWNMLP